MSLETVDTVRDTEVAGKEAVCGWWKHVTCTDLRTH